MQTTAKLGLKKPDNTDTFDIKSFNDNFDILDGLWQIVYPVGSIYISTKNTSPQTLFGGTWTQLENRFLLGAGSSYTAGNTGGAATHTLTTNEMPAHAHSTNSAGAHTHNVRGGAASGGSRTELESYASTYKGTRTISAAALSAGAHSHTINNTGGGAAHNNMPPYLVVYMWERTA